MFDFHFVRGIGVQTSMWEHHDLHLLALSLLVAVVTSILGMHLAQMGRFAPTRATRNVALASGALAFGSGIWAMHFIGMLSYELFAEANMDVSTTMLSMLPSVMASASAMSVLRRPQATPMALVVGGLWMGAGIAAMHYLGMMASDMYSAVRYDLSTFIVSILLGVLVSIFALWIRFGLQRSTPRWPAWAMTLASGVIMGLAIASMHYMGMAAIRLEERLLMPTSATSQAPLALSIALVALSTSLLMIAVNMGLRYRLLFEQSQLKESQLRAVVDTALDGIVMIDGTGLIKAFNGAAERMLGWSASEVIGRNVNILMPKPFDSEHDGFLQRYQHTGESNVIGDAREVYALRRDGTQLPVRLAVGRVRVGGGPLFVGTITDISLRRSMEQDLRRSEEQFRSLIDNIPGVTFRCVYVKRWPMQFISESVLQLTGWTAEEFVEGKVSFADIIHPDDAKTNWEMIQDAIHRGRPYSIEYRLLRRDGQLRWCSEGGRGVRDDNGEVSTIDGVILDNTIFKERTAEYEGVVTALNRGSIVVEYDMQGRVLTASPLFCDLLGYNLEQLQGMHHADFGELGWGESREFKDLWVQLRKGHSVINEYYREGNQRRKLWVHVRYSPILAADGKPFKVMGFVSDLTERREMEEALRAAKEKAEQAAAARGTFLANMSHEIRTPMNAILGFTNVLLDTQLNLQQRRHLETVHQAARSLLRLLNDILDSAKLEKGAVSLERDDFALRDLCEQILASLSHQVSQKKLQLDVDFAAEVPGFLWGDAFRLQQILLNLLGNAIKFTERGRVLLRAGYSEGILQIEVHDTGLGIAPEKVDSIFDPFAQADVSTTRMYGGTGLGTTISRQLAELMGGSIDVRSQLGQGSVFTVRLPLPVGKPPEGNRAHQQLRLPPLKILAVDDVANNLELLEITLAPGGHQVTRAEDGAQAVEACAHTAFDVVLMDLQMPFMDGLEASRGIRHAEAAMGKSRVPIIALSASVLESDRVNAQAAGMDGFAVKPLEPQRLMAEIARVLNIPTHADARELAPLLAIAAPVQARNTRPIDWEAGSRLWGTQTQLYSAIERFLKDQEGVIAKLEQWLHQADWQNLRSTAHRIRGAAGNLSLQPVYDLADVVETAAEDTDGFAATTAIATLAAELARVHDALAQKSRNQAGVGIATTAVKSAADSGRPLAQHEKARILESLEHLLLTLSRSELDEDGLQRLNTLLPEADMAAVNAAAQQFDLVQALDAVNTLLIHWRARCNEED
jgi:two-component system sensor histidine kinase/response regulator